jgi:hypothetical protein
MADMSPLSKSCRVPNTQGATLEEARANLHEAAELVIEANRALAAEDLAGADVIREPLRLTAY